MYARCNSESEEKVQSARLLMHANLVSLIINFYPKLAYFTVEKTGQEIKRCFRDKLLNVKNQYVKPTGRLSDSIPVAH